MLTKLKRIWAFFSFKRHLRVFQKSDLKICYNAVCAQGMLKRKVMQAAGRRTYLTETEGDQAPQLQDQADSSAAGQVGIAV